MLVHDARIESWLEAPIKYQPRPANSGATYRVMRDNARHTGGHGLPLDSGVQISHLVGCTSIHPRNSSLAMSRAAATIMAFNEARAVFKPLAKGPCLTDLYERMRWDMAGACVPVQPTVDYY